MARTPHNQTTTARGYRHKHQKLRARIQREVSTGTTHCWRCHKPIHPTEPWDLGHNDTDRTQYMGPEHRACNRATKTHQAQRNNHTPPPTKGADTTRTW